MENITDKGASYPSIQFIGMAICTTPGNLNSIEEMSDDGKYMGYDDIRKDILARIKLLKEAIEAAEKETGKDSSVLKVFVVPEFFFRGSKGVYYDKVMDASRFFNAYFQELLQFLKQPKYSNWFFVLGTLLTTKQPIDESEQPTKDLYYLGDNLLNVYYRLHPKSKSSGLAVGEISPLKSMLKSIDGKEMEGLKLFAGDAAFRNVLKSSLNYCDLTAGIEVYNHCYVIGGGSNLRVIRTLKKYKSKEDFILNSMKDTYTQSITRYKPIAEKSEIKISDIDDYSIFNYGGIWFGLDICLDHSRQRLLNHLKKNPDNYVDVQIITSCGMAINPDAVTAKKDCYVFNCDGEYEIKDGAENGIMCHTMLKKVEKEIDPLDETSSATLSKYISAKGKIKLKCSKDIYPHEAYEIHIYNPLKK